MKFLFFFETIFEISFWAKNQKEIRFLAFFRRRSITSPNVCPRRVSFFFEHSNAKKTRDDLCNNRRSARAQRPGDVSMHRIGSSHPVRRDARRLAFCQTERERRRRRQKPPLKRREKREKQRTYRCEQRGGGGRGDGRLGELLRQVGRLDRLVDRTVSKGEERAIGERAAKRFIRGESHSSSPHHHHHHGPKNKRTKY